MEITEQPKLRFSGVDFLRVNFLTHKPLNVPNADIQMTAVPHVLYPKKEPTKFKIFVEVNIQHDKYFKLELVALGHFELDREINDDIKKTLVNENSVAILFPYIRSFVNMFTANLGSILQPIIIPTQFFKGELNEVVEQEENKQIEDQQLELK